jgi:hypothetical protein
MMNIIISRRIFRRARRNKEIKHRRTCDNSSFFLSLLFHLRVFFFFFSFLLFSCLFLSFLVFSCLFLSFLVFSFRIKPRTFKSFKILMSGRSRSSHVRLLSFSSGRTSADTFTISYGSVRRICVIASSALSRPSPPPPSPNPGRRRRRSRGCTRSCQNREARKSRQPHVRFRAPSSSRILLAFLLDLLEHTFFMKGALEVRYI